MSGVERFREAIAQHLGLWFGDDRDEFLSQVLSNCAERLRLSDEDYVRWLENAPETASLAPLSRALTVGETYFFRNIEQFEALADIATPPPAGAPVLRLLSAGCASGEEPYSLALALQERAQAAGWILSIRAADINMDALAAARRGWFSPWSLRATPDSIRARWFQPQAQGWVLDPALRQSVSFTHANLARDDDELWAPASYDVIFCRNMMMYFAPAQARALVARIARALVPGGYLFLGHAETLRGLSDAFQLCHSHGTFYYRRAAAPEPPPLSPDWHGIIRAASTHVAVLAATPDAPAPHRELAFANALDLLHHERFADARTQLGSLPGTRRNDPDVLLLEAVLHAQQGEAMLAELTCRTLLGRDACNAGAHYVMALCREQEGDYEGATEYDRIALHLDPHFAMPRLHLGLLAKRMAQHGAARRDLEQALHLLTMEDSARLLLFGGGFSRAALLALCESALRSCGGRT
jgi:chemotaxis protein methyltransferase CheR